MLYNIAVRNSDCHQIIIQNQEYFITKSVKIIESQKEKIILKVLPPNLNLG
jgi:hypothetical protein